MGAVVTVIMMYKLKIALATFQRVIMEIFVDYISAFMQVFLDDFAVYSRRASHFEHLRLCMDRCRQGRLGLNLAKCVFGVTRVCCLVILLVGTELPSTPTKLKP